MVTFTNPVETIDEFYHLLRCMCRFDNSKNYKDALRLGHLAYASLDFVYDPDEEEHADLEEYIMRQIDIYESKMNLLCNAE